MDNPHLLIRIHYHQAFPEKEKLKAKLRNKQLFIATRKIMKNNFIVKKSHLGEHFFGNLSNYKTKEQF